MTDYKAYKHGKDHGKPISFRIPTESYNYLIKLATQQAEKPADIFRKAIEKFIKIKKLIRKYKKQ